MLLYKPGRFKYSVWKGRPFWSIFNTVQQLRKALKLPQSRPHLRPSALATRFDVTECCCILYTPIIIHSDRTLMLSTSTATWLLDTPNEIADSWPHFHNLWTPPPHQKRGSKNTDEHLTSMPRPHLTTQNRGATARNSNAAHWSPIIYKIA